MPIKISLSQDSNKYQLEHFESKVNRYFEPLISEQQLLIKQYRTEATNNVVKKLAKKMGADKILAKMKEAEEFMLEAQRDAKTFFDPAAKKEAASPLNEGAFDNCGLPVLHAERITISAFMSRFEISENVR